MGLFSKIKDLVGIEDVEEDDDILEEELQVAASQMERRAVDNSISSRNSYSVPKPQMNENNKVVSMQNKPITHNTVAFKLIVIEPKSFDECPKLVDNLKGKKPVILNLEKIESDTARKIFDFLSGATYALNGTVQKIANNIFVFAPENVDISASVEHKNIESGNNSKGSWR